MGARTTTGPILRDIAPSRRHFLGLAAISLAVVGTSASTAQNSTAEAFMDTYRWHKRPVIVAAPDPSAPLVAAQRAALATTDAALSERDMVRIEILGENVTTDGTPRPDISASRLRDQFGIGKTDALALLVGKDGGVKIRRRAAITADELFATIDAMPMRRREMGTQN